MGHLRKQSGFTKNTPSLSPVKLLGLQLANDGPKFAQFRRDWLGEGGQGNVN